MRSVFPGLTGNLIFVLQFEHVIIFFGVNLFKIDILRFHMLLNKTTSFRNIFGLTDICFVDYVKLIIPRKRCDLNIGHFIF